MKILFTGVLVLCLIMEAMSQSCIVITDDQNSDVCNFQYCGPYALSKGVYRIPYQDATFVSVTNDHMKHCPRGAIDMHGEGGSEYYPVAAADGWIRAISDQNTEECTCQNGDNCDNNYVWMEHPNGEWTKYTHVEFNSASDLHDEGDWVTAGTVLGEEGSVGCSSGNHLHFEVAVPVDTNTLLFDAGGGWIDEDWADNLIPVFCGISGNVMQSGETYLALDCGTSCSGFLADVPYTISIGEYEVVINDNTVSNPNDFVLEAFGAGLFRAGTSVTLGPGFHALTNSDFLAAIESCSGAAGKAEPLFAAGSEKQGVEIYPNPAVQFATLRFAQPVTGDLLIEVKDVAGRIIFSQSFTDDSGTTDVPLALPPLHKGIYLVRVVQGGSRSHSLPLVIQ